MTSELEKLLNERGWKRRITVELCSVYVRTRYATNVWCDL